MKSKKILIIFICGIIIIFSGISIFRKVHNESKSNDITISNGKSEVKDLEKVYSNTITKNFDGSYMQPLITVAEYKPEFNIKLHGIDSDNDLILINPQSGEMTKMHYNEDGQYTVTTSLEKDIDYGLLIDYRLAGSIRVVDDLKSINDEEIYSDIMENLKCGL